MCRGVPNDCEKIAANAIEDRLHDAEDRVGGDGRVHRAAALLQNFNRRGRGQRLFRGRHAVLRDHRRACGPRLSRITVAPAHLPKSGTAPKWDDRQHGD